MSKITYTDKVTLNENPNVADVNKVKADDLNEIKNVVNANDDKFNYTQEEQRIGTWTNNKPIYRKVYNLTITLDNNYYYTYTGDSATIMSIDNLIRFDYFITNGTLVYKADNSSPNNYNTYLQRSYGSIGFKTNSSYASNYNGKDAVIILEYTKTTD